MCTTNALSETAVVVDLEIWLHTFALNRTGKEGGTFLGRGGVGGNFRVLVVFCIFTLAHVRYVKLSFLPLWPSVGREIVGKKEKWYMDTRRKKDGEKDRHRHRNEIERKMEK